MKILPDSLTLIIVGKWNRYILTVDWLAKNIFQTDNVQIEFSLDFDLPPRFTKDGIRIIPTENRITFIALKYDDVVFSRIEKMTLRLAKLLPVTPVTAFGINFKFVEESPKSELLSLFELADNNKLSDNDIRIEDYFLKRKMIVNNRVLNLNIIQESKKVLFEFNFHEELQNINMLIQKIEGRFIANKEIAENLLNNIYGLNLEMEEEEDG